MKPEGDDVDIRKTRGLRRDLRGWLREPMIHFTAIATALFLSWHVLRSSLTARPDRLVISSGQVERAITIFSATHLRLPTAEERRELIEGEIKTQVYCREAIALGLDRNDEIIQRRLEQKVRFVTEDTFRPTAPTEAELQRFFDERTTVRLPGPAVSFSQIYFNPQLHKNPDAEAAALITRLEARDGRLDYAVCGDVLPIPNDFEAVLLTDVAKLFGAGFADTLRGQPTGRWTGPIRSGFGVHVVLIRKREEAIPSSLADMRESALREWQNSRRAQANSDIYRRMRAKYEILVEMPSLRGTAVALSPSKRSDSDK
jgi:hypothetical protein